MVNEFGFAVAFVATLLGFSPAFAGECDRDAFGGWSQTDKTSSRTEVLIRDSVEYPDIHFYSDNTYRVITGTWIDGLDGKPLIHVDASTVEIDHIIPVCFAWEHGADKWSYEERRAFYNDTRFLIVTRKSLNASKGASPAWEVSNEQATNCEYVSLFQAGVELYELDLNDAGRGWLKFARAEACGGSLNAEGL